MYDSVHVSIYLQLQLDAALLYIPPALRRLAHEQAREHLEARDPPTLIPSRRSTSDIGLSSACDAAQLADVGLIASLMLLTVVAWRAVNRVAYSSASSSSLIIYTFSS